MYVYVSLYLSMCMFLLIHVIVRWYMRVFLLCIPASMFMYVSVCACGDMDVCACRDMGVCKCPIVRG